MAVLRHGLFSPDLGDVLGIIAAFSDAEFSSLKDDLESEDGFDTDKDRCERVAARVGSDAETVQYIISAISYLYRQANDRESTEITPELVSEYLNERVDFGESVQTERVFSRVAQLIQERPSAAIYQKTRRLQRGFIPNAVSFASFVDMRPVFTSDHDQIESLVTLIQFRIATDDDNPAFKSVVFQMSRRSLSKLRAELESIDGKLSTLEKMNTVPKIRT